MLKTTSRLRDKRFTVVSYYTLNTVYEVEILRLIKSLAAFDLDFYIEGIPQLGDWKQCTDYKARFIHRALGKIETPIVFIDADGEVVDYPILFENLKCDVAAFISHIDALLSGTLYLANNDRVKSLVDSWIEANDRNDTMLFEQRILRGVLRKRKDIKFKRLPIGYCQIHNYKFRDNRPTVIHWQASRRTKKMYEALSKEELLLRIEQINTEAENIER